MPQERYENVELVNLTGHDITLIQYDEERRDLPPQGSLRINNIVDNVGYVRYDGIQVPLIQITERDLFLPEPTDNRLYVVSGIIAASVEREDFVTPSRVERGRRGVTGCRALARVATGNVVSRVAG